MPITRAPNRVDKRWFQNKLQQLDMSQRELARRLNVNSAAVVLSLQGKRNFSSEELADISRIFNEPISEILSRTGVDISRTEPINRADGVAIAGGVVDRTRNPKTRPVPDISALRTIVYQTPGSEVHNWELRYEPHKNVPPEAMNTLCVVKTMDGRELVRFVQKGTRSGHYYLRSVLSRQDEEDVQLLSASPVRAIIPM